MKKREETQFIDTYHKEDIGAIHTNHKFSDNNGLSQKGAEQINEILNIGQKALESGRITDIRKFGEAWNHVVETGKEPIVDMINLYNSIKRKYSGNLYVIQDNSGKMYIRDYLDLSSIIEPWFDGNKPVYPLRYREWFIFFKRLKGESAFIKVWIDNKKTGLKDLFLVQNSYVNNKPAWNQKGIKKGKWKVKYSFINSNIFEEVDIGGRKNLLKMKIIKTLEKNYSYPEDWKGQKRWINKLYRLKYDQNLINEYLEIMYYKLEDSTSTLSYHF